MSCPFYLPMLMFVHSLLKGREKSSERKKWTQKCSVIRSCSRSLVASMRSSEGGAWTRREDVWMKPSISLLTPVSPSDSWKLTLMLEITAYIFIELIEEIFKFQYLGRVPQWIVRWAPAPSRVMPRCSWLRHRLPLVAVHETIQLLCRLYLWESERASKGGGG